MVEGGLSYETNKGFDEVAIFFGMNLKRFFCESIILSQLIELSVLAKRLGEVNEEEVTTYRNSIRHS